ncbi:MAG: TlyA family RNA methyltransferase [Deltaproteobacteria bacterium]|nr:TlyA family RNA methyltransferase [Deltaproteobacteria bacterium]
MAKNKLRLDSILVTSGQCSSRSKAQALILAGKVLVNEQKITKAGSMFSPDVSVRLLVEEHPYVSRGALKLEKALEYFEIDPTGKVVLDVGASTGGFTQLMLQKGAVLVHALDVGYGQLDWSLRSDDAVKVYERTNIRNVVRGDILPIPEMVTVDVSFISLKLVIPVLIDICAPSATVICLIKPQFEAGKGKVGKGGVVKEESVRMECIQSIFNFLNNLGIQPAGYVESPIKGPSGNVEYLTAFQTPANNKIPVS